MRYLTIQYNANSHQSIKHVYGMWQWRVIQFHWTICHVTVATGRRGKGGMFSLLWPGYASWSFIFPVNQINKQGPPTLPWIEFVPPKTQAACESVAREGKHTWGQIQGYWLQFDGFGRDFGLPMWWPSNPRTSLSDGVCFSVKQHGDGP